MKIDVLGDEYKGPELVEIPDEEYSKIIERWEGVGVAPLTGPSDLVWAMRRKEKEEDLG